MSLSAASLALAILVFMTRGHDRRLILPMLAAMLILVILTAIQIGLSAITGEGVNGAVFYHMRTGLGGGDITQYGWMIAAGLGALAVSVLGLARLRRHIRPGARHRAPAWDMAVGLLVLAGVGLHPVVTSSVSYGMRFALVKQQQDGFFEPVAQAGPVETPRNLVILYLESLERTYLDDARFPNLAPRLRALEDRAISFTDLSQTVGAGFTIGGMVASQCGTPLILSGGANSMRVNRFLSGATCLGDILHDAGYTLSYLGGASVEFAGKGAFYASHGYDDVTGLDELLPDLDDPAYRAEWGLQDDTLFDLARARFDRLSNGAQPFVLTMLTLDTHHPYGHADTNRRCADMHYGDGENPMLDAVQCTDLLAAEFVEEILSGPHGANTVVAVMSDHLAMVNTAEQRLNAGPRRNLMFILDPANDTPRRIDRPATTLDVAPTLLSRLGLGVARMGFGVDLLGQAPTLPETLGVAASDRGALDSYLMGFQSVYTRLWAFPDLSDGLYVNLERGEAQFGRSAFSLPAVLSFDAERAITQATLGDARAEETLTGTVRDLPEGTRYLWFDACRALGLLTPDAPELREDGLCLLSGRRGETVRLRTLPRSGFLPETDLAALLEATPDDASMPASEEQALLRIGQARGELPIPLAMPALETGARGVLLQSSAFGSGASFLRRQTTDSLSAGQDWILPRGVSLLGIDAQGMAAPLGTLDQCAPDFEAGPAGAWRKLIEASRDRFVAHVIAVHDTAFCGASIAPLAAPLEGLPLDKLRASPMREAYLAVIDRTGQVFEFPNRDFPRLRILLTPQAPAGRAPDAALQPQRSATDTPAARPNPLPIKAELLAVSAPAAPGPACKAPPPAAAMPANMAPLRPGLTLSGTDLPRALAFGPGWWGQEKAGRWSGSLSPEMSLTLPADPDGALTLELGLVTAGGTPRKLEILHGQKSLGLFQLSGRGSVTLDVSTLPRGRPVTLSLVTAGAALDCPSARGTGNDPRALNMMLLSVRLAATQPEPARSTASASPVPAAIAHAGGRLNGAALTNSFDALERNLGAFDTFEIDFNWTSDGELVCLHDWDASFRSRFGAATAQPLDHEMFVGLLAASPDRPRNCDLDGLAGWMRANPGIRIVTDVKANPRAAHEMIAARHPDLLRQFVPQAYQPQEIDALRALGFADVIFTLYRFGSNKEAIVSAARKHAPTAITMPRVMAEAGLLRQVTQATGLPVYVHTINDPAIAGCLLAMGAAGLYTDDLGAQAIDLLRQSAPPCS